MECQYCCISFVCKHCDKSLSTKQHLLSHLETCSKKIESDIFNQTKNEIKHLNKQLQERDELLEKKDIQIRELQDKLEKYSIESGISSNYNNEQQSNKLHSKYEATDK